MSVGAGAARLRHGAVQECGAGIGSKGDLNIATVVAEASVTAGPCGRGEARASLHHLIRKSRPFSPRKGAPQGQLRLTRPSGRVRCAKPTCEVTERHLAHPVAPRHAPR